MRRRPMTTFSTSAQRHRLCHRQRQTRPLHGRLSPLEVQKCRYCPVLLATMKMTTPKEIHLLLHRLRLAAAAAVTIAATRDGKRRKASCPRGTKCRGICRRHWLDAPKKARDLTRWRLACDHSKAPKTPPPPALHVVAMKTRVQVNLLLAAAVTAVLVIGTIALSYPVIPATAKTKTCHHNISRIVICPPSMTA